MGGVFYGGVGCLPSVVKAFRAWPAEFEAWRVAAASKGLSFNAWAREALNEQAELHAALAREEECDEVGEVAEAS